MKRLCILGIILLMSTLVFAQEGDCYKMPRNVAMIYVNSDSTSLCLLFNNPKDKTATIGIFDLQSRELIYQSPLFSHRGDGFRMLDTGILISSQQDHQQSFTLIDWKGHEVWKEEKALGFIHKREMDLGIVIRQANLDSEIELKAISLKTGEKLWSEVTDFSFVRNAWHVSQFGQSPLLLSANKICKYGREKGLLAEYKYKTSPQGANVSVVVSDGHVYLTEQKKLTCLGKNFEPIWSVSHPSMAKNELKVDGSTLQLINYGYIKSDAILFPVQKLNKPYIAHYDMQNGQLLSLKYLKWKGQDGLIEHIYNDTLIYVKNGDAFRQLQVSKDEFLAAVESGDVYLLDSCLQITGKYSDDDVYYQLFTEEDIICVGRQCPDGNDFYLLSSNGHPVRHLPEGTTFACHIGQQLFYTIADSLYCVPIRES